MRTKLLAALAAAAFLVVGCGDNSTEATTQFNDADVTFAQMMYPHHAQAVEMAEMTEGRTDNSDVLTLAAAISAAQQPEMDQLTGLLTEWGQPAPSAEMGAMDHSAGSGMMTQQDMDALMTASGPEFDRQWLTMMIAHHTGAIEMANTEISDGSSPEATELARTIVGTQQQEIDTMRELLG